MNILIQDFLEFKDLLSHHTLFVIGLLLIFGYFLGKLADKIKLPEITGYIISGLLMGDAVFQIIPPHSDLSIVTDVALALIALTIGGEFYITKLKIMGDYLFYREDWMFCVKFHGKKFCLHQNRVNSGK